MAKKTRTAIEPTRSENYPEWYQQVIKAGDLAQQSPVRGCMVIKPWGYAIWENIQRIFDTQLKETGHKNAYFPLFIPLSYFQKEAEHVEGFAKECAVVTHHRLESDSDGKLQPSGPLEEPLVVRPTSETIIGDMFSKWVQSYRDLPILMNQWANIVRWEMRPRMFLRTTEFLWQEGHTVHATPQEAQEETFLILDLYTDFVQNYLALPVIKGEKTESERFPGAVATYTIEAMMQDRKALQAGTSHFLGQNFAKASEIRYLSSEGKEEYAWTTSWGVSTRLIGGLIMTHGDDNGLIIPPRVAPAHVAILPILHKEEKRAEVMQYCENLKQRLQSITYNGRPLQVEFDTRDMQGGEKVWSWIKKGIPLWLEVGPRDVANDSVYVGRRDLGKQACTSQKCDQFCATVVAQLDEMQKNLFQRASAFLDTHTVPIESKDDFYAFFTPGNKENPEIHGGFAYCHCNPSRELEAKLKEELSVTIRCIPFDRGKEPGTCIFTGKPSSQRVIFAKSY